jgi:hypothetical protein
MSSAESLRTQISGKYSPDNTGIFDFRQRLIDLGIQVSFPAGGEILEYPQGFAITTPHERTVPFSETERAFLASIGCSDFHIVYNVLGDEDGYIGESTAVETLDAVSHGVPTVWLRPPGRLSPHIGKKLEIFTRRLTETYPWIEPLDRLSDKALTVSLGRLAARATGIHPFSSHKKRFNFDPTTGGYSIQTTEPPLRHDDGLMVPICSDYELEVFYDIKQGLLNRYDATWQEYRNEAAEV